MGRRTRVAIECSASAAALALAAAALGAPGWAAVLVAGTAFAAMRLADAAREEAAARKAAEARSECGALADRLAETERARVALERRAIEPGARLALLAEAAGRLERLSEAEILPAALDLLVDHLGATDCAAYVFEGEELRPAAARRAGGGGEAPVPRPAGRLVALALGKRRAASARDLGEGRGPDDGMLAAPLATADGAVLGALEVRAMPFLDLTASAERVASLIAEWTAQALEAARARERAAHVPRFPGLGPQLVPAIAAARRGDPVSALVLALDGIDTLAGPAREGLVRAAATVFRGVLGPAAAVEPSGDGRAIAAVLAGTGAEAARALEERARAAIRELGLEPPARGGAPRPAAAVGAATSGEAIESLADLVAAAERAARRFFTAGPQPDPLAGAVARPAAAPGDKVAK